MSGSVTATNTNSSALSALASTPATTQVGANANNAQMNEFTQLLVAQLQNQDPMSPTDPTQFVGELAQFSTVEQLTQSNTTLTNISQAMSGLALGQYAGLISKTVTATATSVTAPPPSGAQENLNYNVTTSGMKNVAVQVTNAAGTVVQTIPVTGTSGSVAFTGVTANGTQLPAGQYNVALVGVSTAVGSTGQSQSAGTLTSNATVSSLQQNSSGAWQLQLSNGNQVAASSVTAVQ
jgi:flagellar basal-body rod modification protein FlgD